MARSPQSLSNYMMETRFISVTKPEKTPSDLVGPRVRKNTRANVARGLDIC